MSEAGIKEAGGKGVRGKQTKATSGAQEGETTAGDKARLKRQFDTGGKGERLVGLGQGQQGWKREATWRTDKKARSVEEENVRGIGFVRCERALGEDNQTLFCNSVYWNFCTDLAKIYRVRLITLM